MWYIVIILSIICVCFYVWAARDYRARKKELDKERLKPSFRSEEDLEEYKKPLKDKEHEIVDFDDAE